MKTRETIEVPAIDYSPGTILSIEHVAAWLGVGVRTVEQMDIPCAMIGPRTKRYLAVHVFEYLDKKAREQGAA